MAVRSERLADLAAKIRDTNVPSLIQSANCVIAIGQWLAEAKASGDMPRGGWQRWVAQEIGMSVTTADGYIALARAVAAGRLSVGELAELGQRAALKAIGR